MDRRTNRTWPNTRDARELRYGISYGPRYRTADHRVRYGSLPEEVDEFEVMDREKLPSHSGRGPKGYQKSDQRIYEDICELLTRHPRVDASEIEVQVSSGEVTLQGRADSRRTKKLIENICDDVYGVRDVNNQIGITH